MSKKFERPMMFLVRLQGEEDHYRAVVNITRQTLDVAIREFDKAWGAYDGVRPNSGLRDVGVIQLRNMPLEARLVIPGNIPAHLGRDWSVLLVTDPDDWANIMASPYTGEAVNHIISQDGLGLWMRAYGQDPDAGNLYTESIPFEEMRFQAHDHDIHLSSTATQEGSFCIRARTLSEARRLAMELESSGGFPDVEWTTTKEFGVDPIIVDVTRSLDDDDDVRERD